MIFVSFFSPRVHQAIGSVRPDHYQGIQIKSLDHSYEVFSQGLREISEIIKSEKVKGQPLETVHELTYKLESAVEFWKQQGKSSNNTVRKNPEQLKKLANYLEEVHLASERQQEKRVRENFEKLHRSFKEISK